MDKFKEIRPIALGLVKRGNKLLVSEGYDEVKGKKFYRCLGGGIEFKVIDHFLYRKIKNGR